MSHTWNSPRRPKLCFRLQANFWLSEMFNDHDISDIVLNGRGHSIMCSKGWLTAGWKVYPKVQRGCAFTRTYVSLCDVEEFNQSVFSPIPFKSQVHLLREHCYLDSCTCLFDAQVCGLTLSDPPRLLSPNPLSLPQLHLAAYQPIRQSSPERDAACRSPKIGS